MAGQVTCEEQGAVAWVTLSHPGKFNAMSRSMWRELRAVFLGLQQRHDLRCVVVVGEAGHFCAGGDIAEYPGFRFSESSLREFHEIDVWGGLSAMLCCDLPVVAAIEGNCMGAGVEMASCCDIRLAAASSRFEAPIARLGFPMAPREAQLVASAVGHLTAREMLLEAAVLPAATLLQRGFLNRLVDDGGVLAEALATAERVTALAPQAARANKQTLRALGGLSNSEAFGASGAFSAAGPSHAPALADLLATAYDYADSAEHREGIGAFLAKRPPQF